jgi:hypothetical protein
MSCQNYSELFINTFIQTLAQLSAVIVSGSLAVPVYNYYIYNRSSLKEDNKDTRNTVVTDTHDTDTDTDSSDFTDDTLPMDDLNDQQFRMEEPDIINH